VGGAYVTSLTNRGAEFWREKSYVLALSKDNY